MSPSYRCVVTILFFAGIYSILSSATFPFSSIAEKEDSGCLKFEINDVYVGNLTHTIEISNIVSTRVRGGKLFVPLVTNSTARHHVILHDVYASNRVQSEILQDDYGNIYAFWDDIEIRREQSFSVKISYHVLSFTTHYLIDSNLVASYNTSAHIYMKYTKAEKLIESDREEISSTAEKIVDNETNPHKRALKIYDFIRKHIHYMPQDQEMGALWALENEIGDCSEYSYLFVALCRAVGIPARVQAGFAFNSFSETTEDGHMWAEYYLEDYGWIPVDSTWRLFAALDDRHFSSIHSTPEVIPYANYIFNCTSGQANDEQKVTIKPCSVSFFEDNTFAENLVNTVSEVKQAEFAIFLGKVFGTPVIFPSEAYSVEQELLECKVYLQNTVELLNRQPQLARSSVTGALDSAEAALKDAWILIAKVFAVLLSIPIAILLVALVLIRRFQVN